jgi:hypothetical protein
MLSPGCERVAPMGAALAVGAIPRKPAANKQAVRIDANKFLLLMILPLLPLLWQIFLSSPSDYGKITLKYQNICNQSNICRRSTAASTVRGASRGGPWHRTPAVRPRLCMR